MKGYLDPLLEGRLPSERLRCTLGACCSFCPFCSSARSPDSILSMAEGSTAAPGDAGIGVFLVLRLECGEVEEGSNLSAVGMLMRAFLLYCADGSLARLRLRLTTNTPTRMCPLHVAVESQ